MKVVPDLRGRAGKVGKLLIARKRSQLMPGVSEDECRAALEGLTDGVLILDPAGIVRAGNSAAVRILRRRLDDLVGRPISASAVALLREDGSEAPWAELPTEIAAHTGRPLFDRPAGLRLHSGSVIWLTISATPIFTSGLREVESIVTSFADVTRRREAERTLRESEQLNRLVLESLAEGLLIRDRTGPIVWANGSAARIFGVARRELIGATSATFVRNFIDEDSRPMPAGELPGTWTADGAAAVSDRVFGAVRKDGSTVWLSTAVRPIQRANSTASRGLVISFEDITARRAAEQAVQESEERFIHAVRGSSDGIWDWDFRRRRYYVSPRFKELLGYRDDELANDRAALRDRLHPDDRYTVRSALAAHFRKGAPYDVEARLRHRDGTYRWFRIRGQVFRDADGRPIRFSGANSDISDRKRAEDELAYLAHFDALTGLPNRALFRDRLTGAMARAKRSGYALALLLFDLDRFKEVNDTFGHAAGDAVLRAVATRVRGRLRQTDTVARLAGDEFTVILDSIEAPEQALAVAKKIREVLAEVPVVSDGHEIFIAASIGIALYPRDAQAADELVQCADSAMYAAKREGGQNFRLFTRAAQALPRGERQLEAKLRRALERAELSLEYQPQIEIGSGRVIGAEALARWRSPELGAVSPSRFIPVAEETGLILPIGEWVLEEVCRQGKSWQDAGLLPLPVSVNLSARQFRDERLPERVATVLKRTGLAPRWLELEIAESTVMQQTGQASGALANLQSIGVRVSIDNFGTGYSSLAYLKRFPAHRLKIDRAFIREITANADDAAIVKAVITMAEALQIGTIAEGVETAQQLAILRSLRCREFQGYLFSRPLPAEKFAALLRERAVIKKTSA
jgi:diguanylate cyclase (GGDEF)-like protein/PAS domain S-box-containing protein